MNRPAPPLQLASRPTDAHKGNFGKVLLVGGSRGMSGAIALSSMAALHTGSGLVSAAIPDRCLESVTSFHPGVMTIPLPDTSNGRFAIPAAIALPKTSQFSAIGCGPGMTTDPGSISIVEKLTSGNSCPLVLDADALNCLTFLQPNWQDADWQHIVLTPHPGEFQRLTGTSSKDRVAQIASAQTLASACGAIIILKGGPSVVISPQETWTNTTGNPGMATAGSGDVLTGVVTSLLGQGMSPWDAARLGCWIHGLAGDLAAQINGQASLTCQELLDCLPAAVQAAA